MNEAYRLELSFANAEGKSRKISIRKPVLDLTETEIQPVMELIAANTIFDDDGVDPYEQVKSARYIRTSIEDIFEA